ncbi:hypothetical protein MASR2M47_46820 [Draconibacterium sp.]
MDTIELKNNLHHLIDSINNDRLLSRFYSIIVNIKEYPEGKLWSKLSDSEREELLLSDKESNDPMNLIPHSEIEKKHKKWL